MGTSKGVDQFAAKMIECGRVAVENRDTITTVAGTYKDALIETAKGDTGGDGRMSRWGRNGTRLNAGYEVKGKVNATAVVNPRPLGAWRVLEDGAKPHLIVPGLTRRQTRALSLFSLLAGQGGGLDGYDVSALAATERGNRNNRSGRRRRKVVKPLLINGNVRAWARHPGTKPKNTFTRAMRRGDKAAPPAAMRTQVMGMAKVLR